MCRYFFIAIFALVLSNVGTSQNKHNIQFKFDQYQNDTLVVGYYFGERQLVIDTLYAQDTPGHFAMEGDSLLHPGVYIFLTHPDNGFYQFLMPREDQEFEVLSSKEDFSDLSYKGSTDNELFSEYVDFLATKRPVIEQIKAKMEGTDGALKKTYEDEMRAIDTEVKAKQAAIIADHPETLTTMLLKANQEVEVPDFSEVPEEERKMKRYRYYKEHYFDHIDLTDSVTLYSPFIDDRVKYYLEKLTIQLPDSINPTIDKLFSMMGTESSLFKYYLGSLYNQYAKSKVVGMDAVIVHLVDNYYIQGLAPWMSEENMAKIADNANKIRPTLMGNIAQDITVYKEDGSPVSLDSINYEYLVLLFWAPDCGHCKKVMPNIVEFGKEYKSKGVEVFAICTKHMDKLPTCWEAVKEKDMLGFINAADQYHKSSFKTKYDIRTTPKIFILDKDKKILIKGIGGEQLPEVMDEIIKSENAAKNG